jgi:hypothetical protein
MKLLNILLQPREIWQLSSSAFFYALKVLLRIKPCKKRKDKRSA